MTNVAIVRCEKNETRCPLTNCLKCLMNTKEGFAGYDQCFPVGVVTCRCPGEDAGELGKILKARGAEAIHFCTCAFASREDGAWRLDKGGFCDHLDNLIDTIHKETGIPCIKGTAHLPEGYTPEVWK